MLLLITILTDFKSALLQDRDTDRLLTALHCNAFVVEIVATVLSVCPVAMKAWPDIKLVDNVTANVVATIDKFV